MDAHQLFPKKLTIAGLIVLMAVFSSLLWINLRNLEFVKSFYEVDVPSLQLYSGASRLVSNNKLLEELAPNDVSTRRDNQEGVISAMSELKRINKDLLLEMPVTDGEALSSAQLEALNVSMQSQIENYLIRKNKSITEQVTVSRIIGSLGLLGVICFFVLLYVVYKQYTNNIRILAETTTQLEEQRLASIQSSKLASLGEMAAGVAHEINNPLSIISATALSIRRFSEKGKLTPDFLNDSLGDIEQTVGRISRIIVGLRNIARDSKDDLVPISLRAVLDDVLAVSAERIKTKSIDIRVVDQDAALDREILGNRVQLSQVFLNLIVNSVDAILEIEEKWIELKGKITEDGNIQVRVSDSGNGISPAVQEKIFQPFFTTKDIGKGTGLGLSISKNIIEKHSGQMIYEAHEGHTSFVITLPVKPLTP